MTHNDRLPLFPSRTNLVVMKLRVQSAIRGLNLLKRKRDALKIKLRELQSEYKDKEEQIFHAMSDALNALSRANFAGADLKPASLVCPERADVYMRIKYTKIVGLHLPYLELYLNHPESCQHAGLSKGGEQVLAVRKTFQEVVRVLVETASLQYSIITLKEGMRQTTMRCNGLEYVLIPRFNNTLKYIINELEEIEREEFYRLKRSQAKQREVKEAFQKLVKLKAINAEEHDRALQSKHKSRINSEWGIDELFDMSQFEHRNSNKSVKKEA